MNRIVVVGCGSAKLPHTAPARDLYTGRYFRKRLAYARSLVPDDRIYVLSAKHGLVALDTVIAPYDLRLQPGRAGLVARYDLVQLALRQTEAMGLEQVPVTVLAGHEYVMVARAVWGEVDAPLAGGIGEQIAWLTRETAAPRPRRARAAPAPRTRIAATSTSRTV